MKKKDKNDYLDYYKREQRADDITLIITIIIVFILPLILVILD